MNKQQLVAELSIKSEITKKEAEKHVTNLFDIIMETVAVGEDVKVVGFGKFEKKETKGRKGVSKLQGVEKPWKTEDSFKPYFDPSKAFEDKVKA